MSSDLTARYLDGDSQDDIAAVFQLLAEASWNQHLLTPVDPVKAVAHIITIAKAGAAVLFETDDGDPVATIGLDTMGLWYGHREVFVDVWCAVRPAYQNPRHLREMLTELKAFSRDAGLPILIAILTGRRGRIIHVDGTREGPGHGQ